MAGTGPNSDSCVPLLAYDPEEVTKCCCNWKIHCAFDAVSVLLATGQVFSGSCDKALALVTRVDLCGLGHSQTSFESQFFPLCN